MLGRIRKASISAHDLPRFLNMVGQPGQHVFETRPLREFLYVSFWAEINAFYNDCAIQGCLR